MLRMISVLAGLILACLAAALVLVLHVIKPLELAALPPAALAARLLPAAELTALIATRLAIFAIPFGALIAAVAEVNRWRGIATYLAIGLAVAGAGFLLHYQSEGEMRTILNAFAAKVFVLQGLCGGSVYWLVAGRYSGWRRGGGPFTAEPLPE